MRKQHLSGFGEFDEVLGPLRGPLHIPKDSVPEQGPCSQCQDSGIIRTNYHGPPGDDRGYLPCFSCQQNVSWAHFDSMRGGTYMEVLNYIKLVANSKKSSST